MKICKDGRIWGQTDKGAGNHLGILTGRKPYIKKGGVEGNKNPMFGRKADHSGSKNPNWKGGISSQVMKIRNQIETKLWRQAVYNRDNWTCQKCRKRGGRMNAHHIKSFAKYPELRFAIDNGETLCFKCHKAVKNLKGDKD